MAAIIKLPSGIYATIIRGQWFCPDPHAMPMLEYFAEEAIQRRKATTDDEIAQGVVEMIVGARFIRGNIPESADATGTAPAS